MNELLTNAQDTAWLASTVRVAAWTLLHFFWQGGLVAGALAVALTLLRQNSSHLRYGVACAALGVMAALPVATGLWLSSSESLANTPASDSWAVTTSAASATAPSAGASPSTAANLATPSAASTLPGGSFFDPALPWLVALWLAGVAALSCVHLGGWIRVRRLRHQGVQPVEPRWQRACANLADRLGIRRPVELLASTRVAVPTVVGWLKPVVLFPLSTFTGLEPRQLESILAHELAHVRRHDYFVNVLQVALETLLFYHPAIWWASRKVRDLREHCCDDLAVAVCGDRMVYARALADLEELRFATPVFALGADGGSLLERIRRLAGKRSTEGQAIGWIAPAVAAFALVATATVLAFAGRPSLAQEAGTVDPAEVGIRSPTFLPPMIIAQVTEEEGGTSAGPRRDDRPRAEAGARPNAGSASLPLPLDELIEMKIHGLDDLLEDIQGTAFADLPTRQLLEMAKFGVDNELIRELDAAGYRDLQADELTEMAKFGVDGELIAELQAAGLGKPSAAELVRMAKFGVDGDYIQEMRDAGYQATAEELVAMAKFGVDSDLMRELAAAGFSDLPGEELAELAKFGVDGDYIQEMRGAGYQASSTSELVRLAKFGVDSELVRELADAGFGSLPAEDLVELAKFGVDGDYIQEMRGAGYEVTSPPELVELAKFGVDDELIAELTKLGYRDLAADELVELAKFGVDGDFIRELHDAGYEQLSVDDLTRMARHGIDAEFLSKMHKGDRI